MSEPFPYSQVPPSLHKDWTQLSRELLGLPLPALKAFMVRCHERVHPLRERVDVGIVAVRQFADSLHHHPAARRTDDDLARTAAAYASRTAAAAYVAVNTVNDDIAVDDDDATMDDDARAERSRIMRAIWSDLTKLYAWLKRHGTAHDDSLSIDPSESGPLGSLWPEGRPAWWPKNGHAKAEPAVPTNPTATNKTFDQLAAELVELEGRFPPPNEQEIIADCRWLQDRWGTDTLAPFRGTHVAIFNGAVVGHGDNSLQLELDLARKFGVHPQRLVIEYIPRPLEL